MANVSVISVSERNVVLNVTPEVPIVNVVSGFAFGGTSDVIGSNVGGGVGVYKTKVGGNLQFKSFISGDNINITTDENTITIDSTANVLASILANSNDAGGYTITNLGTPTLGSDAARLQDLPTTLPPNGLAGGDLTGSYPAPTLVEIPGLVSGTYGDAAYYPILTVDEKGRVTAISQLSFPSSGISGTAGGDLTGTYPNPTINLGAVSYDKIQQVTGERLLGRMGADGVVQEIELGAGLIFSAGKLEIAVPTEVNWLIDGNAVTAVQNLGTTTAYDLPLIVNNVEVARFKVGGVVQLLSTPHDDTQDRILVQDVSGNIAYRDITSFPPDLNAWQLNGSTVTTEKDFGTVDAYDIPFITNNVEVARLSTDGTLGLGIDPAATNRLDVLGIAAGNIVRLRDSGNSVDRFKVSDAGIITITQPAHQDANTRVLTVNTGTGEIEYRDASTLGGGTGVTDGDKGDITVASTGTVWTIDNDAVTYAKMQNVSASRLLGRYTASTGDTQEISLGAGLTLNTGTGVLDTVVNTASVVKTEEFTANGVLTSFTAVTGTIDQLLAVFAGGVHQREGTNFTLTGNTVDFTIAPVNGTIVTITYFENLVVGAGSDTFASDVTFVLESSDSFGKYRNGDTAPWTGLTAIQAIEDAAVDYIDPSWTTFSISGQSTTVEIGTTLSGSKTFIWNVDSNSGTVATIDIYDNTAVATLLAATPDDGTQAQTITTIQLNTNGATQSWKGIANNTSPVDTIDSSNFVVTSRYLYFYAPSASSPANSAAVRALTNSAFYTGAGSFTFNTGTTLTKFVIALPPSVTITSVVDETALGAVITTDYVLTGTINVLDAGATNRSYNIYEMNIGAAYSVNHAHTITIS